MREEAAQRPETYEGFSVGMALMDAVPVLAFGIGCLLIGFTFGSILFVTGASLCFLGGLLKVLWKLILGLRKKDVAWMNKQFRFTMSAGFLLIILSVILNLGRIDWANVGRRLISFPAILFFVLGLAGMVVMGILAGTLDKNLARSNWIEQSVNCCAQLCILAGIICCLFGNGKETGTTIRLGKTGPMEGYWVAISQEDVDAGDDFSFPDYFLEFRGNKVTVRDYDRDIILKTTFALEESGEGEKVVILKDRELAYGDSDPYGILTDPVLRDGFLCFSQQSVYDPKTVYDYVGTATEEGPFDYLQILDEQYLEELQGTWVDSDFSCNQLEIKGNTMSHRYVEEGEKPYTFDTWTFHVVCTRKNPDYIYLIGDDLIETYFDCYAGFRYKDGILHTDEMVLDADWDTSVDFEKLK